MIRAQHEGIGIVMYKQQQGNQRGIVNATTMWQAQRMFYVMCSKSERSHMPGKYNNHKHKRTNFYYNRSGAFSNITMLMAIEYDTKCTRVNISII